MAGDSKSRGKKAAPAPAPAVMLVKGQLWKFDTRYIRIEHVGKHLVEHRSVSLERPQLRAPKRMIGIKELQAFLAMNQAVLVVGD